MSRSPDLETRAAIDNVSVSGRRLVGRVARFGNETRIGDFREVIRTGAFAQSLEQGRDILALLDHNPSSLLGRTRSGTLSLTEDTEGLAFELNLPNTRAAADVLALAERGDLGGMSFGFTVPQGGDHWQGDLRELRNVQLHEISVVQSWPAYSGTEVAVRSRPVDYTKSLFFVGGDNRHRWLELF